MRVGQTVQKVSFPVSPPYMLVATTFSSQVLSEDVFEAKCMSKPISNKAIMLISGHKVFTFYIDSICLSMKN